MKNKYALIHFLATNENETEPYDGLAVVEDTAKESNDDKLCDVFANIVSYKTGETVKYARVLYKDTLEENEDVIRTMLTQYVLSTLKGGIVI